MYHSIWRFGASLVQGSSIKLNQATFPGFFVMRTNDILVAAEEFKEKQTRSSVQELSLVDVTIGKLLILTLSADDSLLVACMDNYIHFSAVSILLHKPHRVSYTYSPTSMSLLHYNKQVS